MSSDPFAMTFKALWDLTVTSTALGALVQPRNMIRYDVSDSAPMKDNIQSADVPELTLVTEGTSAMNLHYDSCASMISRRYAWLLHTGDHRVVKGKLYPVEFALLCAMTHWPARLGALVWNGTPFVQKLDLVSATEGLMDTQLNRGVKGWSAIWRVDVMMIFKTQDLIDFEGG